MPDHDNWTAAMVLKWVLTRDEGAVLAMVDTYGARGVFEDHTVSRLTPEDIDAVMIAYCIDRTLPLGEEKDATAVVRSQRVIAAKDEIYQALRRGELEARARRNGVGDVETIAPNQWLSLKFQSRDGHDLAVPINVERDILDLPWAFEDYVGGRVPAYTLPTIWPDPHFISKQVLQIWPCHDPTQMGAAVEVPTQNADEPGLNEPPELPDVLSDTERKIYEAARQLKPGFDKRWGGISEVARLIAKGRFQNFNTVRRTLTRALQKLREQNN
jgi:hypothetical protein